MSLLKRVHRRPVSEINVVPYIDVMLVLLVIFMITAPLLSQGVNVDLPNAAAKPLTAQEQDPIIVSVDLSGQYFLNIDANPDQPVDESRLLSEVSNQLQTANINHQTRSVYVKGDRRVDYGRVVQAMVLLQKAGAQSVGLITKPNDQS